MARKIFDIVPPKKEKSFFITKKRKESPSLPKIVFPRFPKKGFLFLFLISFFIVVFALSFKFSRVQIKIWPEVEELSFVENVTFDTRSENIDLDKKIIPGKFFESEETFSNIFSSTGKVLKKAEGTIRLFNEYTTQNEVWKEGTRFVSSDGKLFKSKDKIVVPGAKIKNGKIEASFVDVPVIAAEGGSEYNIGPTEFSILAFKGSPRYFKYYGKSFEPMKGGGTFHQVLKEDLERAENELINIARQRAKDILEKKAESNLSFFDDLIEISVLEKNSSAKEGDEVEKFEFKIKTKIKTIVVSNDNLKNFAKEYLNKKIPKDKEFYLPSLQIGFKGDVKKFELGKATLQMKISAKVYPKLETLSLKKALAGKNLTEAKFFLLNQKEILKSKIEVYPFWIKNIPDDLNRIEIFYPFID
jgi:hypothetical protein